MRPAFTELRELILRDDGPTVHRGRFRRGCGGFGGDPGVVFSGFQPACRWFQLILPKS